MITLKEKDFNLGSATEFSTRLEVTKSVTNGYVDLVHTTYENDVEYVSCISLDLEDVKAIAEVFGCEVK